MKFISQIIRSNFIFHNEKIYIKSSYLNLFTDSNKLTVDSIIHRGRSYFCLKLIPAKIKKSVMLPEIALINQELYALYPSAKNPYFIRYLNSLKNSLLEVMRNYNPFVQTYSDYKLDSATINRKALTHAVLYFIIPFLKKFPDRYDAVFQLLKELDLNIELMLSSIDKFYKKLHQIIRMGLPCALLSDVKLPLDSS